MREKGGENAINCLLFPPPGGQYLEGMSRVRAQPVRIAAAGRKSQEA